MSFSDRHHEPTGGKGPSEGLYAAVDDRTYALCPAYYSIRAVNTAESTVLDIIMCCGVCYQDISRTFMT